MSELRPSDEKQTVFRSQTRNVIWLFAAPIGIAAGGAVTGLIGLCIILPFYLCPSCSGWFSSSVGLWVHLGVGPGAFAGGLVAARVGCDLARWRGARGRAPVYALVGGGSDMLFAVWILREYALSTPLLLFVDGAAVSLAVLIAWSLSSGRQV